MKKLDSIFKKYNFEHIFIITEIIVVNFIDDKIKNATDILKQNYDDVDKNIQI